MTLDLTFASHYIKEHAGYDPGPVQTKNLFAALCLNFTESYAASNKRTLPAEAGGSVITLPVAERPQAR